LLVPALPVHDFENYHTFALHILSGRGYGAQGYPSATWAPGYSFFLAGLYALFGKSYLVAKIANVVLQVLTIALTYLFCRIALGVAAARWAAVLLALWPGQIAYAGLLASETLFTFLFMIGSLLVARLTLALHEKRPWVRTTVAAGVVIGVSALVRGPGLVLVFAAPLTWLLSRVPFRTTAKATLLLAALTVATISPWTIRNWVVMRSFILISGDVAWGMWMGANPHTTGRHMDPPADLGTSFREQWRAASREALGFIRRHPLTYLSYAPRKLWFFVGDDSSGFYWSVLSVAGKVPAFLNLYSLSLNIADVNFDFYVALLLLSLVGLVPCLRAKPVAPLVPVVLAVWVFIHILLIGDDRFHVPLGPFLATLSGSALAWCSTLLRRTIGARFSSSPGGRC
jgi:4-amino-4-deoxy-L-arabinose transferase-like glycosyltransferase